MESLQHCFHGKLCTVRFVAFQLSPTRITSELGWIMLVLKVLISLFRFHPLKLLNFPQFSFKLNFQATLFIIRELRRYRFKHFFQLLNIYFETLFGPIKVVFLCVNIWHVCHYVKVKGWRRRDYGVLFGWEKILSAAIFFNSW